jgi:hypothetical protein
MKVEVPDNATGMWCVVQYSDEDEPKGEMFMSFGEYSPEVDEKYDSNGFLDELVFAYPRRDEVGSLYEKDNGFDFFILSHEFYYQQGDK